MQNQPPYTPGGPLSTGHYEFSDEENSQISLTGARARLWGVISLITGALALVGLIVSLVFKDELISHGLDPSYVTIFVVSLVPIVLTHLVISMLYIQAGKSLQAVVATQGNDIEHLLQSLEKLGTAFLVEFAIGLLAIIISVGAGVQMAIANVDAQKAADAQKAQYENDRIAAAAEEDDDEDEGEGDTDEDSDDGEGEEESAEADDAEDGDTDDGAEAEAEEGGEGEDGDTDADADADDGEEAADGEDAAEGDEVPADEPPLDPTDPDPSAAG